MSFSNIFSFSFFFFFIVKLFNAHKRSKLLIWSTDVEFILVSLGWNEWTLGAISLSYNSLRKPQGFSHYETDRHYANAPRCTLLYIYLFTHRCYSCLYSTWCQCTCMRRYTQVLNRGVKYTLCLWLYTVISSCEILLSTYAHSVKRWAFLFGMPLPLVMSKVTFSESVLSNIVEILLLLFFCK